MRFGGRPVLLGGAAGAAYPKLASDRSSASTVRVCRGGIVCSLNFLLLETLKGQFYHVTRHGPGARAGKGAKNISINRPNVLDYFIGL